MIRSRPDQIQTGITDAIGPASIEPARARTTVARDPRGRLGRPGEVAGDALRLASDDTIYVIGDNPLVDGGWMAS